MKKTTFGLLFSILVLLVPAVAAQAYSNQPQITSIDQVDPKQPVNHDVNWIQSDEVIAGDRVLDYTRLTVTVVATLSEVCTIEVAPDVDTYSLTTDTCAELGVYNFYNVKLVEVYSDDTESSDENLTFYTNPPKPKSLEVKRRLANSMRLKFKRGVQIAGEYLYVEYIVARGKNTGKIVGNGELFTGANYIDVADLPAGKSLQIKMRFVTSDYGNSAWSSWTKFKTKED
jgi:hypothetical protein